MRKIILYSVISAWLLCIFSAGTAIAITSDDFNSQTLDTSLWTITNPWDDATFSMVNTGSPYASLKITIPEGRSHDVWRDGNWAPRINQTADNSDFEVEVKFQSLMNKTFQIQGIIIEQDEDDYLRFDFHSNGQKNWVLAANFTNGSLPQINIREIGASSNIAIPLYMRVKRVGNHWTQNYSIDGIHWIAHASFDRTLTVKSVGPFVGNAADTLPGIAPAFTGLIDYFFNTSSRIDPEDVADTIAPNITLWYGNSQRFGQPGVPQKWVNILGNVYDESGVTSLNYSLNHRADRALSMGPDYRLESSGDFNVEIDYADLLCGDNMLEIQASDARGNSKTEIVSINYSCNKVWPKNYTINWSDTNSIQDAAQIVDGRWTKEANSVRPLIIGYDRLIAIGDMNWTDYEIIAPITINSPLDPTLSFGGPNFGFITRWQGHYPWDPGYPSEWIGKQPNAAWYPLGGLGVYIWDPSLNKFILEIIGNRGDLIAIDTSGKHLEVGIPYMFKMRAKTNGTNTRYSLKVWQQNEIEPGMWTLSGDGVTGELKQGSVTLGAHNADVSFGNVTIRSGPFEDTQPVAGRFNISGYKINASNNNGLPGWNITITGGPTTVTTTTDATGYYIFTNLVNGTYTVTEETKTEWTNVTPVSRSIIISGKDGQNVNFTNQRMINTYKTCNISGHKINYSDNTGIPGWKITITGGPTTVTTTTDATGYYIFTNLVNGTYTVTEETKTEWMNVTPVSRSITISGNDEQNVNFTNQRMINTYKTCNISGHKINYSDNTGIPGWKITITGGPATVTTITDATGYYIFTNLVNGTYTVTEEMKTEWTNVTPVSRSITISGKDELNINFTNQIQRIMPGIIEARVKIKPETMNMGRKGEFTVYITLPDPFEEKNIKLSTLICKGAHAMKGKISDDGSFIAKFNTQDLNYLHAAKEVNLEVTGKVRFENNWIDFKGSDTIRIIKEGKETKDKDKKRDDSEKDKDIEKDDIEKDKDIKNDDSEKDKGNN